jgi:hypothetical protein
MNDVVKVVALLFRGTMYEPIANALEAGLANGTMTVDEGKDLVDTAAPIVEQMFPNEKPEVELGKAILDAAATYYDAKKAQKAAAAAPPAPAPTPAPAPAPAAKATKPS